MVVDHWFMQNEKVLEAMEITSDATRIRLAVFKLEGEAQVWGNGQGPLETLEEPFYVSSSLGTRARLGMICRGCELEISGTLLTVDLRIMDMSRVRCHPWDGLADSLQGCYRL